MTASNCTFWNNYCNTSTDKGYVLYARSTVKLFNNIIDDDDPLTGISRIHLRSIASLKTDDSSFPSPLGQAKNFIRGGVSSITAAAGEVLSPGDTSVLILSGDPGFIDSTNPIGPDGIWGTSDDGLRFSSGSIAIEQGLSRYLPQDTEDVDGDGDVDEIIPVDLAGYSRVQGTTVDLGAYETGGDAGPINLITAPASQTILSGQAAAFEVLASGYSLSYQWYEGSSGDISNPIEDAVWKSWETESLASSLSYWVRIYNGATHLDSQTVMATVMATETYASWVTEHELSGNDALDTATPAGDGVSNLMKYALGLDPDEAATSTDGIIPGKPAILESDNGLTFTFLRNAEASDVSYTIEFCDDLISWEPVLTGVTETVLSDSLIKVEVSLPSGGAGFCRLSVTK